MNTLSGNTGAVLEIPPADLVEWFGDLAQVVAPEVFVEALVKALGEDTLRRLLDARRNPLWWSGRVRAYSQRDPEWARDRLGYSSTLTLGSHGCAVTAAAMLCSLVDATVTPRTLNAQLQRLGGFGVADIAWAAVPRACPGLRYVHREDWDRPCTDADLAYTGRMLDLYGPQIIEVDFHPETTKQEQHFVVGLYMQDGDLRIIDPWTGVEGWLLKEYATDRQDLKRALWGIRVYEYVGGRNG